MQQYLRREIRIVDLLPLVMLLVGLYLFPLDLVKSDFSLMPGDKGDTRFNNYILEHGYKFIKGETPHFWDAPFMYPQKGTIAFSDNLLGTLPVYAMFRELNCDRETAFQWWFIALFVLNFVCCYLALKWWSKSTVLSSVGAYIFAFSIFVLCHINHVQVFPRFMIPLVVYWTWIYLNEKRIKHLFLLMMGLTIQFYSGVYLGFFLVYILFFMIVSYLIIYRDMELFKQFRNLKVVGLHVLVIGFFVAVLLPMFIPYMEVSGKYGYRSFEEVSLYIPTWKSYFSAIPESSVWCFLSWHIRSQGWMWWEQFLFVGGLPWVAILLLPFFFFSKMINAQAKKLVGFLLLTFILCVLFSLKIDGFTLYKLIFKLPGFGSMRSINRLINAEVVLQILILVFVFKYLINAKPELKKFAILLPLLVVLDNTTAYWERTFNKAEAQSNVNAIKDIIQSQFDSTKAAIAYQHFNFAGMETESHLNVMLATQDLGLTSVNAYTGLFPYNYQGFSDAEGLDSLNRWMDYNQADIKKVQMISEFGAPYQSRKFGKLTSVDGKYLTVDKEKGDRLFANANAVEKGEFFEIAVLTNGITFIRSSNGKYLCAEIPSEGKLVANRDKPGEWEQFSLEEISPGVFTLKNISELYIHVNEDGSLSANSTTPGPRETFTLHKKK
jgi:hypothetical protein